MEWKADNRFLSQWHVAWLLLRPDSTGTGIAVRVVVVAGGSAAVAAAAAAAALRFG
jgi:hypothetical protein